MSRYPQYAPDQEARLKWRDQDFKIACCDCGLVHRFTFRVEGDEVVFSAVRDNRATAQIRRGMKPKDSVKS